MGSLGKLLVLKLVAGKVVSIEDQQTHRQTNRRTDRFGALLYRYVQYAYQMKAENTLNLKLLSEDMICYIKICIGATFIYLI